MSMSPTLTANTIKRLTNYQGVTVRDSGSVRRPYMVHFNGRVIGGDLKADDLYMIVAVFDAIRAGGGIVEHQS